MYRDDYRFERMHMGYGHRGGFGFGRGFGGCGFGRGMGYHNGFGFGAGRRNRYDDLMDDTYHGYTGWGRHAFDMSSPGNKDYYRQDIRERLNMLEEEKQYLENLLKQSEPQKED